MVNETAGIRRYYGELHRQKGNLSGLAAAPGPGELIAMMGR